LHVAGLGEACTFSAGGVRGWIALRDQQVIALVTDIDAEDSLQTVSGNPSGVRRARCGHGIRACCRLTGEGSSPWKRFSAWVSVMTIARLEYRLAPKVKRGPA
jgi:hypothetical protein